MISSPRLLALRASLCAWPVVLCAVAVLAVAGARAEGDAGSDGTGGGVDLIGTWYVLVHYRDTATANPEAERWLDRLWVFEKKASRLHWTEYPIVVFGDESGRFEMLGTNRQRRVMQFWEPNEGQLARIHEGLEFNPRGSRSKSLRGSVEEGFRSFSGMQIQSASVIGYQQTWSIEGLPQRPVFQIEDFLGSARTGTLEGVTRYETTEVLEGGDLLRGIFQRDESRSGIFTMMRAGVAESVGTKRTQAERLREHFLSQGGLSLGTGGLDEELAGADVSPETRRKVLAAIRSELVKTLERAGANPNTGTRRYQVDYLMGEIERLIFEEGKSLQEVESLLRSRKLRPPGPWD
jgi:hypothetical protein